MKRSEFSRGFDHSSESFHKDFERQQKRVGIAFTAWFIFVTILSLAILAALCWGGYELIEWIKTK